MKITKKILATLLTITMLFSTAVFASAESDGVEVGSNAATNEALASDTVAKIYLNCQDFTFPIRGHSWIYVENLSDEELQIGLYTLPPNEGVSAGTFSFSVSDGFGIYYNVEAFRRNERPQKNCYTISEELNMEQVKKLSDALVQRLNTWDFFFNCVSFSFTMWNAATGDHLVPTFLPGIATLKLRVRGAEKDVLKMYYPEPSRVYQQVGTGKDATLKPVSESTLYDYN